MVPCFLNLQGAPEYPSASFVEEKDSSGTRIPGAGKRRDTMAGIGLQLEGHRHQL